MSGQAGKPPGFDPKDAAFAMNRADELEHVQGLAEGEDAGERTALTKQPGPATLLEPMPVSAAPRRPPREYAPWVSQAFSTSAAALALAAVLVLTGSAMRDARALGFRTVVDRLLGRAAPAGAEPVPPRLAESVLETPLAAPRAPAESEVATEPYSGFGFFVESAPEGAMVSRKGQELGETPLAQGEMECVWGEALVLTITKPGHHAWTYEGPCRRDTMLKLSATLRRR